MTKKKKILIGLLILFVLIQFKRIDKVNPQDDFSKDFIANNDVPDDIALMIKASCYDCHSHHSKYPWYSNIAPVSWWVKGHIDNGRKKLNYSNWTDYAMDKKKHKLEEMAEEVTETFMPLGPYILMHPEARLSTEDRTKLASWFNSMNPN
jgi:hypothetical protein